MSIDIPFDSAFNRNISIPLRHCCCRNVQIAYFKREYRTAHKKAEVPPENYCISNHAFSFMLKILLMNELNGKTKHTQQKKFAVKIISSKLEICMMWADIRDILFAKVFIVVKPFKLSQNLSHQRLFNILIHL